ncbi:5-azacytidine-induced protein 2 isoform X1 [Pseudophryne corroboree]|uniref:5-azacytidine-induced protein 2 isoform X1 n=1 Tax=Pseudophryne corroboree TaxID=495146 RepID=UPI0030817267
MDSLIDDDICILTHEKEDTVRIRDQGTPVSASSGEASVASHFALVTAYEDIKKRLKDTERENYSLKRKLRQMEEKLCGNRGGQVMGESDKVNKAYGAFREICIERDILKKKLIAMEEKIECTRNLNEQLQSKEVELLQVKSELETQQVMKSLSKTPTDWEIEKLNSELKIRSLEQEVKLLQEECGCLQAELQRTKDAAVDKSLSGKEDSEDHGTESSESSMRQAYWELKKEMSNLHLVTEVQAEVLRKLKGTVAATKKASHGPVQCEDDLEKTCSRLRITAAGVTYEKLPSVSPKGHPFCGGAAASQPHEDMNTLYEQTDGTQWTSERPIPVGGDCEETDSYQKSSSEETSWVMPSPPKPSETLFWEMKNNSSANNMGNYYTHNYTFKS